MLPDIHNKPERKLYDKILYEQHVTRVKNILPTIDNRPPRKHPLSNRKIMEENRTRKKIEQENFNILIRIAKSVQTSSIDNKLSKHINRYRKFKKQLTMKRKLSEHRKIIINNHKLLKRIIEVQPSVTKYIL